MSQHVDAQVMPIMSKDLSFTFIIKQRAIIIKFKQKSDITFLNVRTHC